MAIFWSMYVKITTILNFGHFHFLIVSVDLYIIRYVTLLRKHRRDITNIATLYIAVGKTILNFYHWLLIVHISRNISLFFVPRTQNSLELVDDDTGLYSDSNLLFLL